MKTLRVLIAFAVLALATTAFAQPKQNGFSVVLLIGDTQNAGGPDGLPAAPGLRKALNDVKEFLPYKSYRLLDSQWLRGGLTRMKGPDDQEYEVEVVDYDEFTHNAFPKKTPNGLTIVFTLKSAGPADQADLAPQLDRARAKLDQAKEYLAQNKTKYGERHPVILASEQEVKKAIAEVTRLEGTNGTRGRKLIDSQFQMEIGETVVVGTSRIGGDKGLVVLLTAVAAGK
jgi:hypothetical protein